MNERSPHEAARATEEPIAWLRAFTDGGDARMLPLFRRAARLSVGSGKGCDWRFESAELADVELVLAWDGVRLRAEDGGGRTSLRHGQSIVAGKSGRLRIELEVLCYDAEVTEIRRRADLLPAGETTAPIALAAPVDDDQRTVVTLMPPMHEEPTPEPLPPAPPPGEGSSWRLYVPPRNGVAAEEPTAAWPLEDALRPTADLLERLGQSSLRTLARRTPPRRVALLAALVLVVALEATLLLHRRRPPAPPPPLAGAAPAAHAAVAERRTRVVLPDKEVEVDLHRAIAAYRAGKSAESAAAFTRVAEAVNDPAARTMLFILRTRGAATP